MRSIVAILVAASVGATLPAIASAQDLAVRPMASGTLIQGLVYVPRGVYAHSYSASRPVVAPDLAAGAELQDLVYTPNGPMSPPYVASAAPVAMSLSATAVTPVVQPVVTTTVYRGLTYQPRGAYAHPYVQPMSRPEPGEQGYFDLHGGVFEFISPGATRPNGARSSNFGMKLGFNAGPAVRLGTLLDWQYRSESNTVPINTTQGPGGTTITNSVDLGSGTSSLVPWMGFLEISPVPRAPISPYVGIAGGYEWLNLHATRSDIPVAFDANYGGWGWQAWGGMAFKLGPVVRMTGEVYGNFAEPSRDAYDTTLNAVTRETVNVDGAGVRAGLQFLF
jgi:hypothetical protein